MSSETLSVIRGYHYFDDGSVALHTVDLVQVDGIDKEQFDMYYYYSAHYGCDYKLSYMTGRNIRCKDCKELKPRLRSKANFPTIPEGQEEQI